jgi:drug/metabolite transporter (DMT)-like permease
MPLKNSFHPFAMITIIGWSLAYVFTRMALAYFTSETLGMLRYITASLALAVLVFATRMKPPKLRDIPWFVLAGAIGFFIYVIAFNKGCETVPAATSSVVIALVPIVTALLARVIFAEKLSWLQWAALALGFAGVIVLNTLRGGFKFDAGILWLMLAVALLSSYNILQRRLTKTYSALVCSTYGIFFGTLMLLVFLPSSIEQIKAAPLEAYLYVLLLGVVSGAIAYVAWSAAFARAKNAASVSNYMFVTPFLTSLLGFLIAGETPDAATLIGGAIIISSLVLFTIGKRVGSNSPAA